MPRFTVIVPTRARPDLVVRLVERLREQEFRDFEVVVVVDGADDDTVNALNALELPFPLTVLEQAHGGAAAARNAGAAIARGEILLFLDDDMAPDAALLAQHDRSYRAGAQMVLGHLPLDPASPKTATAAAIGGWAERRRARLAATNGVVPVTELISGQMSLFRRAFEQLGGFDLAFTRGGLVPGADRDFGYRARRSGLKIVFNPDAISYQFYEVDPEDFTRRSRNGARGDRILALRYPEIAGELWHPRFDTLIAKLTLEPLVRLPHAVSRPLRAFAIRRFSQPQPGRLSRRLFFAVQTMERRRGARVEMRALRTPIAAVLAYGSVTPDAFASQLDELREHGWSFVDLERLLEAVTGGTPLPSRCLLVTFDGADVLSSVVPILEERGIPAVVFAIANNADALREAAARGVVVGARAPAQELVASADRIESVGVPRPQVLSYPPGEWSPAAAAAVAGAGYRAGFTVAPEAVRRLHDPYALPRIEVLAGESGRSLARRLLELGPWRRQ